MKPIDGTELKKHIESAICYGCEIGHVVTPCARCYVSDLLRYIYEMPEVGSQPMKHGRWTECWRDPERNVIAVICMACGDVSHACLPKEYLKDLAVDDVPKKICIQMPYCPKCGAKMCGGDTDGNQV